MEKLTLLYDMLRDYKKLCVAFSGGTDSSTLLAAALTALGNQNVLAVTACTPLQTRDEIRAAEAFAAALGAQHVIVSVDNLSDENVAKNDKLRCYYCKKLIFSEVFRVAAERKFAVVADGTNADDIGSYRPGRRALSELGVKSPVRDCGISKPELREIAAKLGLPLSMALKPARPCLATRLPYGRPITLDALSMIERGEKLLEQMGLSEYRLRHHADTDGDMARIEVPKNDFAKLLSNENVLKELKAIGYRHVTLDLQGFRSGSYDEPEGSIVDK